MSYLFQPSRRSRNSSLSADAVSLLLDSAPRNSSLNVSISALRGWWWSWSWRRKTLSAYCCTAIRALSIASNVRSVVLRTLSQRSPRYFALDVAAASALYDCVRLGVTREKRWSGVYVKRTRRVPRRKHTTWFPAECGQKCRKDEPAE